MPRISGLLTPAARLTWLAAAFLYILLKLGQGRAWWPAPVAWYGPDLLCMPLILGGVLAAQRLAGRSPTWRLPWWHGLVAVALYAIWFEGLEPLLLGRGTADPVDVAAYIVGWGVFSLLINR